MYKMSQTLIDKINKTFLAGCIPPEFNYGVHPVEEIDWDKVRYNSFYRSYEFAESKFPKGYDSIRGFDKVIEACIPKVSPLEEMEIKQTPLKEINLKNDLAYEIMEKRLNGSTDQERFERKFELIDDVLYLKKDHIDREIEYNNNLDN